MLAAASFDATVSIWDRRSGGREEKITSYLSIYLPPSLPPSLPLSSSEFQCSTTLEGHENEVKSVAWSSSGSLLATCSRDKSVWVWEGGWTCVPLMSFISSSSFPPPPPTPPLPPPPLPPPPPPLPVLDDGEEFECAGVLTNHTQDVKCVRWHPLEEVRVSC